MSFDADTFLAAPVQGALSTTSTPPPAGEHEATVVKLVARQNTSDKGTFTTVDVTWELDDPNGRIKAITNRDKNTCRQSIFLDLTEEGKLDTRKGMNVGLGIFRDALGQNDPNKPWSFSMPEGHRAKVNVIHETRKDNPEIIDAKVNKVAALRKKAS